MLSNIYFGTFCLKKSDKHFLRYVKCLCAKLFQMFLTYIETKCSKYQTQKIKTFWPRDVTDTRVLTRFQSKIYNDCKTISSLYVLNCLKYFLIYNSR